MLINRFRGSGETDLKMTLTNIYNKTFGSYYNEIKKEVMNNIEEIEILEEIKQELIQEELDWYLSFDFKFKILFLIRVNVFYSYFTLNIFDLIVK